jgi:hypothetical protein
MKKTLLMTIFVFGVCGSIQAGTCPTSKLATYDAVGFTCNIGSLDFSNFSYHPTGLNTPSDANVEVDPIPGAESGFEFFAGWSAGIGNVQDSAIKYTVSCDGCSIIDLVLSMEGNGASGDSFINIAESSGGAVPALLIGENTSTTVNSDLEPIPPTGMLNLTKDILLNGGSKGFGAAVSEVDNFFSTTTQTTMTPEPRLLLLCMGALCLFPVARKIRRA